MRARIKSKRGGSRKLKQFRKLVEDAPDVRKPIVRNIAEETLSFTKERFRVEKNPYGKTWAPKKNSDGRKVLSGKTSRLKGGWHVAKMNRRGFTVAPSVKYATFHQTGTTFFEARTMVPEDGKVPKELLDSWIEIAKEILSDHFKQ